MTSIRSFFFSLVLLLSSGVSFALANPTLINCQSVSNVILSSTYQLDSGESTWIKAHFDSDSILRLHILEGEISIVSHSTCESDTIHQFSTNRYTLDVDYFLQGNLYGNEIFYHLKAAGGSPAKFEFTLDTAQSGRTIDNPIIIDIATDDGITLDENKQWFTFSTNDDKQVDFTADLYDGGSIIATLIAENGKQSFQEKLHSDDCGNVLLGSMRLSPNIYNIRTVNEANCIIYWSSYTYYPRYSPGELQLEDGVLKNQHGVGWFRYSLNPGLKITNRDGPIFKTTSSDTVLLANTGFDIYRSCLPAVYSAKEVTDLLIEVGGTSCDFYCPTFSVGAFIPVDSFDLTGSDKDFPLSAEFNVEYEASPGETSWYQIIIPVGHQLGIKRTLISNNVRITGYTTTDTSQPLFDFREENWFLYQWPYPPIQEDNDAIFLSSEHSLDTLILSIEVLNPENTRDNFLHSFITREESRGLYCGDAIEITSGMTTLSQTGEIFYWDYTKKKLDLLITVNKNYEQFILNTWNDFLGSTSDDIYHCYANYPYPSLVRLSDSSSTHTQFVIETSSLSSSTSHNSSGLLGFKIDNWEGELNMNVHYINVENEVPYLIDSILELREDHEQGHLFDLNYAVDPDNEPLFYGMRDTVSGLSLLDSINQLVLTDYDLIRSACSASVCIPMYVTDMYDTVNFELSTFYSSENCPNRFPIASDTVFQVMENSALGSTIGQLIGQDPDNDTLRFQLLQNDVSVNVVLEELSGKLKINDPTFFNYELNSSVEIDVIVTDEELNDTINVLINIEDINDPPVLLDLTIESEENAPNGFLITNLSGFDEDSDDLSYALISSNMANGFSLDTNSGELYISDSSLFDYELNDLINLQTTVFDGALYDTASISIQLIDLNEEPQLVDTLYVVNENPLPGHVIGYLFASDPEQDKLTYTLEGTDLPIEANDSTGELIVVNPTHFNYEIDSQVSFSIQVSDGALSNNETIAIHIQDINEAPNDILLTSDTLQEYNEEQTFIGILSAVDEDKNEVFIYDLINGANDFKISTDSLFAIRGFDFEKEQLYEIEIQVTDQGGLSITKTFDIKIIELLLSIKEKELSIYPNPTSGVLFIDGKDINSVSISDLSGRTILKTTSSELDLSQLVNGTYLIFIEHTNGTGELIKVRLSK